MESARRILTGHRRRIISAAGAALAAVVLIAAGSATAAAPVEPGNPSAHVASVRKHHRRHHHRRHHRHHRRRLHRIHGHAASAPHPASRAAGTNGTGAPANNADGPLVPAPPCTDADTPATEAAVGAMRIAVECLVNQERTSHGLPALADDSKLTNSAQSWSDHMVATGAFTHGTNFSGRVSAVGYDWQEAGENIATGYATPRDVVEAWMASPEHCQNILDPDYTGMGTGLNNAAVGSFASAPSTWTQDFGLLMSQNAPSQNQGPMNGCPYSS